MWWNRKIWLIVQNSISQFRRRPPARVRRLLGNSTIVVSLCPFEQFVEISTFVHCVKVRMRAVVGEYPVGRDGRDIARTHHDLSEVIDAVI